MTPKIQYCRICKSSLFHSLLDLGEMSLTGIFPKENSEKVPTGPLELVKCQKCDLVQLGHSFDLGLMYGDNYGYRSGLNGSMVRHLNAKVQKILKRVQLKKDDLVIDIGSNDSTTLRAYPDMGLDLLGVDPSAGKFRSYYPSDVRLIEDFFSERVVRPHVGNKKAKVVTSIAMFYDLEDPQSFVNEVSAILATEGVWVFEQSYLKAMLEANSYDTICHEHLEYYGLKQIVGMIQKADLKIIDVEFNDVNGGSFSITAARRESSYPEATRLIDTILADEDKCGLYSLETYRKFAADVEDHRKQIKTLFASLLGSGKRILGYGASTKGNVLLQYCGLTAREMICIAEVNEDKFGRFTPGTDIPILSEALAKKMKPDYFFVLPWHFKAGIIQRESEFLQRGGKFIFPLSKIDIVSHQL